MPDAPAAVPAAPDFDAIKNGAYGIALREEINELIAKLADVKAAFSVMLASRDQLARQNQALRAELEALKAEHAVAAPPPAPGAADPMAAKAEPAAPPEPDSSPAGEPAGAAKSLA